MVFRFTVLIAICFALGSCVEEAQVVDNRRLNKSISISGIGADDRFCRAIGLTKSGLALTSQDLGNMVTIQESTQSALAAKLPSGVSVVADPQSYTPIPLPASLGIGLLQANTETLTHDLEFKGLPFCGLKVISYMDRGNLIHYGSIPNIPNFDESVSLPEWPEDSIEKTLKVILGHINEKQVFGFISYELSDLKYDEIERCLGFDENGNLFPYWEFSDLKVGNQPASVRAIANESRFFQDQYGEVLDVGSFTVQGFGNVLKRTPNGVSFSFDITKVTFEDIGAGNFLCNSKFVPDNAVSQNGNFNFDLDSENHALFQVTIFNNANVHSDWISSLPSSQGWPGPQIRLTIDDESDGTNNTAVYYPNGGGEGVPQIQLGDGDGRALKNLWKDPEVVSHELGHHLVYRKLTVTRGEPLVLHEGLADYFVFARTGNPCLAETICPATSTVCDSTQCLRTADNDLKLDGPGLPSEPHKISQLISGLLWDIGNSIGQEPTADIVYHAINYLKEDSGYTEFLVALMAADKDLNQGRNACLIKDAALLRGFAANIENVDCNQFIVQ
ncbi:MAG: hypothetical protein HRU09_07065 [Oligoflexales bacterium]|nr:hypothetical protein [Oligoflexales bacterium]